MLNNTIFLLLIYPRCANEVLLVHQSLQKQETVEHLKHIEQCYNTKQVRRLNLGVATIIWFDYNSKTCNTYLANCSYLKLKYSDFYTRILDIGFMDHWFILNEKMMDYDVNY